MNKFAHLEYRLNDENKHFPAIYHYNQIDLNEIFCRRMCDYWIKDRKIFRKTSCSREKDSFVIYVEEDADEELFDHAEKYEHITLEIRLYNEEEESPLLFTYDFMDHQEVLEWLGNDFIQLNEFEYEKITAEIDEDRSSYVLYVHLTGFKFS